MAMITMRCPWNRPWRRSSNSQGAGFAWGLGRLLFSTGLFTRFIGVGASSCGRSIAKASAGSTCMHIRHALANAAVPSLRRWSRPERNCPLGTAVVRCCPLLHASDMPQGRLWVMSHLTAVPHRAFWTRRPPANKAVCIFPTGSRTGLSRAPRGSLVSTP
jgi:hypothetical protein